ncbi:DEAD/DEAH box helicase family protein [Bradyrhizobium sp. RDT10]
MGQNRPRALVQMATGAGKTFTACTLSYRLLAHAGFKQNPVPGRSRQSRSPDAR